MAKLPFCVGKTLRSPYEKLEDFHLHPGLIKALNQQNLNKLSDLHKAVGPNLFKGSDTIIVADGHSDVAHSKRVTSYLLPILQVIHDFLRAARNSKEIPCTTSGPAVLILTATQTHGLCIETLLQKLLHGKQNPPIHSEYVSELKASRKVPDILVTDMTSVQEMMRNSKKGRILFEHLRFLVFEETNEYDINQWDTMQEIVDVSSNFQESIFQTTPLQLVATASKWSVKLEQFYLETVKKRNICLFIDLLPELIRFAKISWKVNFVKDEETKKLKLLDILCQQKGQSGKTVISCEFVDTAEEIKDYCSKAGLSVDTLKGSSPSIDNPSSSDAIVITDHDLGSFKISDCTRVVNYDSSNQRIRLKSLWRSLPTVNYSSGTINRKALTCYSLLTGEEPNYLLFYRFLKMLEGTEIHPDLDDIGNKLHNEAVAGKPLCNQIKLFGSCERAKDYACYDRHSFNEGDLKEDPLAPCHDEIEVSILKCINPSHYIGVLNKHFSNGGETRTLVKSYEEERQERQRIMTEHYSEESNRKFPRSIEKGMVYAFLSGPTYRRVRLEGKVLGHDNGDLNKISVLDKVTVQCLDTGLKLAGTGTDLMVLEPEFQEWKQHQIEIVLCNVCPPNNNTTYTPTQCALTRDIIFAHKNFSAKVWISIGNMVWVSPMTSIDDEKISLRAKLIESRIASGNKLHLEYLYNSIKSLGELYSGFEYLKTLRPKKSVSYEEFHGPSDGCRWAFMGKSKIGQMNAADVKITWAHDPWLFYGILAKHEELVDHLEDELNSWASNMSCEPEYYETLQPNSVVAVKISGSQTWVRGLVVDKWKEKEGFMLEVFLVDNGETVLGAKECEVLPILKKFVSQLPFQCIGFSLSHIEPFTENTDDWTPAEKQIFWDMILPDGYSNYLNIAALDELEYDDEDESLPCRCYSAIVAMDGEELGAMLVRKLCAVYHERISDELIASLLRKDEEIDEIITGLDNMAMEESDEEKDDQEFYERFDTNFGDMNSESSGWLDDFIDATKKKCELIKADMMALRPIDDGAVAGCSKKMHSTPPSAKMIQPKLNQDLELSPDQELIRMINDALRHPTVLWHQTASHVIFNVQLPDVKEYELKIAKDGRIIRFESYVPSGYGFYTKLFGRVLQDPKVAVYGQYVYICLEKKNKSSVTWCRLLQDKHEKPKWLKENPEYLRDDEEEQEDNVPKIRQTYSEKYDKDDSTDSCEEDEEDEDLLFRAPDKFLQMGEEHLNEGELDVWSP